MKQKKLNYGQTPFDSLTRDELLMEVRRMYNAITAARSVMSLSKGPGPENPFWANGGSGHRALSMADQILDRIHSEYSSEEIYRAYFRYAEDLLFDGFGFGWDICPKCGQMVGKSGDGKRQGGKTCKEVLGHSECDGVFRPLQWSDLTPAKARE